MKANVNLNSNSNWLTELIKQIFRFIRRLSKPTKLTITVLAVLMTFWVLSVYFIGRHFYDNNPTWTVLLLCFVISVSWLVANVILISFGIIILSPAFNEMGYDTSSPAKEEEIIVVGGLNSIVYLTAILIISVYNHFSFSKFIVLSSCYPVFALILLGIAFLLINKGRSRN